MPSAAEEFFSNHSLVYLRKHSELCRVEPQFRPALPPIHPRFSAYSCSIEVRLMYVCCPFINRTTIGQQSNNNRTTMGRQWEKERRKGLGRVEQNWRLIGEQLENDMYITK